MPLHDWTRVDEGLFHAFHLSWIIRLCDTLNGGGLPSDYFAIAERSSPEPVPDVLDLPLLSGKNLPLSTGKAVAVADVPPRARMVRTSDRSVYPKKADRVTVRHRHGEILAVIEVVSPGNKGSKSELQAFVEKMSKLLQQGVHGLVIDLFPPTKRDPQGINKAIWDEIEDEDYTLPVGKPLTVAAYSAGAIKTSYVEEFAVGDELPDMPLFLEPELYVPVSLEATYRTSWGVFPGVLKGLLEPTEPLEDQPPSP